MNKALQDHHFDPERIYSVEKLPGDKKLWKHGPEIDSAITWFENLAAGGRSA
jgi:hypothetical protein